MSRIATPSAVEKMERAARIEQTNESLKGFITAPDPERLRPTPEEQRKLKALLDWMDYSAKNNDMWD